MEQTPAFIMDEKSTLYPKHILYISIIKKKLSLHCLVGHTKIINPTSHYTP